MDRPNPELMELYGTDQHYLEKCGALPPGLLKTLGSIVAPTAFLAAAHADKKHQDELMAEAELMNRMFHAEEHARMAPVREVLGLAAASDRQPGVGPEYDIGYPVDPTMRAFEEDIAAERVKSSSAIAEDTGRWMAKRAGIGGKIMGFLRKSTGKPWGAMNPVEGVTIPGLAQKTTKAVTGGGMPTRRPLISTGTKLKLLGTAGLAGVGYMGLKGAQAARDYMMIPTGSTSWGRYGPAPAHGMSSYGYVTPRL